MWGKMMNPLEMALLNQWGEEKFRLLQGIKIGIAGAGGLGSNCAVNLVRSGFKRLVLVDFDKVEMSNLNRQFYFLDQLGMAKVDALRSNLLRINPELELETYPERMEPGNLTRFFNDCQVLVEAVDRAEIKRMIIEYGCSAGKFLVSASGLAGYGDSDGIQVHHFRKDLIVVGDLHSAVGPERPPVSPRVNVAAAKQADCVLEWVLKGGAGEQIVANY